MSFPLRLLIGLINALLLLIAVGASISLLALVALNALNDQGDRYVEAVKTSAKNTIQVLFDDTAKIAEEFKYASERYAGTTFTSLDPTGVAWDRMAKRTLSLSSAIVGHLAIVEWHFDGARQYVEWFSEAPEIMCHLEYKVPTFGANITKPPVVMLNATTGHAVATPTPPQWKPFCDRVDSYGLADIRKAAGVNVSLGRIRDHGAPQWTRGVVYQGGEALVWFRAGTQLWSDDGTHLGYSLVVLRDVGIAKALDDLKTTPNALACLVAMNGGFVLASSGGVSVRSVTPFDGDRAFQPPAGCFSTAHSAQPSSAPRIVCNFFIGDIPALSHLAEAVDPMLISKRSLLSVDQTADAVAAKPTSSSMSVSSGGKWFVRTSTIPLRDDPLLVVVAVPEKDVFGSTKQAMMIAIIVSAVAVVLIVGVTFVVVWFLLQPLKTMALRMASAAKLQIEHETYAMSPMSEIKDLQISFGAMYDELQRIRSFVPQALLFGTTTEEDTDGNYEDEGEEETGYDAHSQRQKYKDGNETSEQSSSHFSEGSERHIHRGGRHGKSVNGAANSQSEISDVAGMSGHESSQNMGGRSSLTTESVESLDRDNENKRQRRGRDRNGTSPTTGAKGNFGVAGSERSSAQVSMRTGVKLRDGLKTERVSVLVMNIRGFNVALHGQAGVSELMPHPSPTSGQHRGKVAQHSVGTDHCESPRLNIPPSKIGNFIHELVGLVQQAVEAEKGVVALYHGDRFMVTFNATRPAAAHSARACRCAMNISTSVEKFITKFESQASASGHGTNKAAMPALDKKRQSASSSPPPPASQAAPSSQQQQQHVRRVPVVSIGVATGTALVGSMGSATLKVLGVIGPVVSNAAMLERLCKAYSQTTVLIPNGLVSDVASAVSTRTLDFVMLPGMKRPTLISSVLRELAPSSDDEWLYQMQAQEEGCSRHDVERNDLFAELVAGKMAPQQVLCSQADMVAKYGLAQSLVSVPEMRARQKSQSGSNTANTASSGGVLKGSDSAKLPLPPLAGLPKSQAPLSGGDSPRSAGGSPLPSQSPASPLSLLPTLANGPLHGSGSASAKPNDAGAANAPAQVGAKTTERSFGAGAALPHTLPNDASTAHGTSIEHVQASSNNASGANVSVVGVSPAGNPIVQPVGIATVGDCPDVALSNLCHGALRNGGVVSATEFGRFYHCCL